MVHALYMFGCQDERKVAKGTYLTHIVVGQKGGHDMSTHITGEQLWKMTLRMRTCPFGHEKKNNRNDQFTFFILNISCPIQRKGRRRKKESM